MNYTCLQMRSPLDGRGQPWALSEAAAPPRDTSTSSSSLLASLDLSNTSIYEPQIRALLGTAPHFCQTVVLELRTVPNCTTLSLRILRVIRRGARSMYKRGGASRRARLALSAVSSCRNPQGLFFFFFFFFFMTLEPRVEWYKSLCDLNTSPPRNRCFTRML